MTCEIRGEYPPGEVAGDHVDNMTTVWFGSKDCIEGIAVPATPEDSQTIEYVERCQSNQYKVETKTKNTWSIEHCQSMKIWGSRK